MEIEAKLTSKGQITIPKEIRRALQVESGDTVVFEADAQGVHLRARRSGTSFADYEGIWREGEGKSIEEIIADIRDLRGDGE